MPQSSFSPTAHSFPIAMLSRTMNPYTKEVLEYVSWNTSSCKHLLVLLTKPNIIKPISDFTELNPLTVQKNAAGKIIIVYDEDERIASQAATNMCQRGVENLFMLSGGTVSLKLSARTPFNYLSSHFSDQLQVPLHYNISTITVFRVKIPVHHGMHMRTLGK